MLDRYMNIVFKMPLFLRFSCLGMAILCAALFLPLLIGVWLPDVFGGSDRTLASATLTNGYSFQVVQYWNHIDFYTTELRITSPDGKTDTRTLDGDDAKSWSVPMKVDEQLRVVSVTLGGGRLKQESW